MNTDVTSLSRFEFTITTYNVVHIQLIIGNVYALDFSICVIMTYRLKSVLSNVMFSNITSFVFLDMSIKGEKV